MLSAEGSLGVDGSCTFSLTHSVKVSAGAEMTRALLLALDAPPARASQPPTPLEVLHGREGTIRFELHATDKKGGVAPGTAPLALGVVDMGALLDENKVCLPKSSSTSPPKSFPASTWLHLRVHL